MDKIYENAETGCCPRFDPKPWDGQVIKFSDKLFLKDRVLSVFHIPLNMGKVMVRNMEKITRADALNPKPLMLSDENSLFGSDIYIAVKKDVPDSNMVKISGNFLSKVFEGPYSNMGKWVKEMDEFVKSKGKTAEKIYFFYTTCPKCAKAYGKNYTVILAKVG
ncbi:MAG: hydrolase [Candidatus Micrarchaeota archaeon]